MAIAGFDGSAKSLPDPSADQRQADRQSGERIHMTAYVRRPAPSAWGHADVAV